MRTQLLIGAAVLTMLTGCSSATDDRASASPSTASSTSASAPEFPDFATFAQVDANRYFQSYPYFGGIMFSTPDGLTCDHNAMNSRNDPGVVVLSCTGPRPNRGPGMWKVRVATDKAATIEQASDKPPEGGPYTPLPARHAITYEGILCGVDGEGTTACRIGDHGFVLTPTETRLF